LYLYYTEVELSEKKLNMLKSISFWIALFVVLTGCSGKNTKTQSDMGEQSMNENEMYMLIGTYTSGESNGIYVYKLDTVTGTSTYISETEVENPSYMVLDSNEKFVYAVTENDDPESSSANTFSFDKEKGKLTFINKQSTLGAAPCYININSNNKNIVTANYGGGSISVFNINDDGSISPAIQVISFTGKGPDKDRQSTPHLHCVQYTPDGKFLFANDLGADKIHKFDVNSHNNGHLTPGTPPAFDVKPGSGPRHLEFHPDKKYMYLITELSGDVIVFEYNNGNLNQIQTILADELNAQGSADIHVSPDGKFLYASNRLEKDGIAIFSIDQENGKLTKIGYQETGIHPRNFAITRNGNLLLVATKDSHNVEVYKRNKETGLLENTGHDIELNSPVCIKFASIN